MYVYVYQLKNDIKMGLGHESQKLLRQHSKFFFSSVTKVNSPLGLPTFLLFLHGDQKHLQ